MHLLADINSGRDVQDLIQLDHVDQIRLIPALRFHELFWIKRLSHQNVQHFAWVRLSFAHDLRIVEIELRFAVAPVAAVLQKPRRKLRGSI